MKEAEKRATMPTGAHAVLSRRTIANSNANLLRLVKKGGSVLDVGCGSGSITRDIVDLVGETGVVKGIDTSQHLIDLAQRDYAGIPNLSFEVADINSYSTDKKYDVITSARVLQWLANPEEVLNKMQDLLAAGGCLTILDYNHKKIEFEPALPSGMKRFYDTFLKWREDCGMDNQIADHLEDMFRGIGLKHITAEDQSEISVPEKPSFQAELNIWQIVAETRGVQLVKDGYITEPERQLAIDEYKDWVANKAEKMKLYLKSVTGYREG
jgi:ubiquinone/menaquinone biosynthesis C-methylase UbiE